MKKYRVEVFYWVSGSGFSHNETVDNTNDLLTEEELKEFYGEYLSQDGGKIELIDNETDEILVSVTI